MFERKARFVHYTSAASGLKIIDTKTLWMRNTNCMSDFREVQHGLDALNKFFSDDQKRKEFFDAIDACANGLAQEAITLFNGWWNDIRLNTYIASISEHDDKEDNHGRLSMWRAFAPGNPRVALVLKPPYKDSAASSLNVILSPVAYFTDADVETNLRLVVENVRAEQELLRRTDRKIILSWIFHMFRTGVVSLKHEGFHEEREWRVIYSPKQRPSTFMKTSTEVIDGVPQIIHAIPLGGPPPDDLEGIDIPHLLDRVIVGPSQYPWVMYEAFVAALKAAGVPDADTRVWTSGIPIRT
jgi:hypothetical protein